MTEQDRKNAIDLITEVAGNPDTGAIADLIALLKSATPAKEARVVEAQEKR